MLVVKLTKGILTLLAGCQVGWCKEEEFLPWLEISKVWPAEAQTLGASSALVVATSSTSLLARQSLHCIFGTHFARYGEVIRLIVFKQWGSDHRHPSAYYSRTALFALNGRQQT